MNVSLLRADQTHLDAIAALERECFPDPWSKAQIVAELANETSSIFVAKLGDEVCGFAIMRALFDEGELFNIAVSANSRKKGVGEKLMQAVTSCAKGQGCLKMFLEVRVSNEPAIALYKKCGFEPLSVRKKYYDNPPEDALIMMLTLDESGETENADTCN